MTFRTIILKEAKRQKLSGYRIAKMSGLPMRTVQLYLAGTCDLCGERVAAIAKVLGLELIRKAKRTKKGCK